MGYRTQSADTAVEIERVQFAIFARMTAAEKLDRVRALSRMANRLALAGIRRRHPRESEQSSRQRLAEMRLGALAQRLVPRADE